MHIHSVIEVNIKMNIEKYLIYAKKKVFPLTGRLGS
jgi:hypothetical protein